MSNLKVQFLHLHLCKLGQSNNCIIYLNINRYHFFSLGLFSHVDGILPAQVEPIRGKFFHDKLMSFIDRPNWIRILKLASIATYPAIELICLSGILLSFFAFVTTIFCVTPIFMLLWTFFYSLVDITRDFHHQSDDLLLEAGLVCILLAPMFSKRYGVSDNVMLVLMKWVLFRYIRFTFINLLLN